MTGSAERGAQFAGESDKPAVATPVFDAGMQGDSGASPVTMAARNASPPSDANGAQYECRIGNRVCRWAPNDHLNFGLSEMPKYWEDYDKPFYTRIIDIVPGSRQLIAKQITDGLGGYATQWYTVFNFESDRPSKGELDFVGLKPFGVFEIPTPLRYRSTDGHAVACAPNGNDLDAMVWSTQESMRTENGQLLYARGDAPLRYDGSVMLIPGDLSEVSIRWVPAGCEACKGWLTVALELTVLSSGATVSIIPGERATFQMSDHDYVLMSQSTERPTDPDRCGDAFWSIYRTDFWIELNEDGTAPKAR